jgi:hypothetical protein
MRANQNSKQNIQEAKAGGLFEPRSLRSPWAVTVKEKNRERDMRGHRIKYLTTKKEPIKTCFF